MAQPSRYQAPEHDAEETSELLKEYMRSKPLFASKGEAAAALSGQLEKLAADHGMAVDALIQQAHTTNDSQPHHIQALHLERQVAYLRR